MDKGLKHHQFSITHLSDDALGLKNLSKSCKYLKEVNLFCCANIADNGIRSLNQNCRQLRTVDIGMCQKISGVGFQGCLPTLACLKAHSCVLSSTGITEMLSGGGLEYLNLANFICIGCDPEIYLL
ncbi:hypothetical protein CTI12_AA454760 [Artemisia annua]|uniref:Uncharacterized protein n=1 Tax=Artemisia annua TaxID=35608 RepID=A0A2U1LTW4_ARTAN|nr:hypothetical protein CTI12_AA454760 [Artemisia annua]